MKENIYVAHKDSGLMFFRNKMILVTVVLASLAFISCGTGTDAVENTSTDSNALPQGAIWTSETIHRATTPLEYTAVIGFALTAALDPSSNDQALVEVDYMRLIERNTANGAETIVAAEEYNDGPRKLNANEGGLYMRFPRWFPPGDVHTPVTTAEIRDGFLIIDVAKTPDKIVHWWTDRATARPGHRYYIEINVRVTGQAALQLGSDWWRSMTMGYNLYDPTCITSNNCEAWHSNWIVDTKGIFVVNRVPIGD